MSSDQSHTHAVPDSESPADSGSGQRSGHIAVIHVHGMGNQRRYEETSQVIDGIDSYLTRSRQAGRDKGAVRRIEPESVPHHSDDARSVTYIGATYLPPKNDPGPGNQEIRFYEAYWAPVMANSSSARRVFWWILRQSPRPVSVYFTPWRERARLRRAALQGLAERRADWVEGPARDLFDRLLHHYEAFGGLAAQRDYPEGSHAEFQEMISQQETGQMRDDLLELSRDWLAAFGRTQLRNFGIIVTILLAMAEVFGLLTWTVLELLSLAVGMAARMNEVIPGLGEFAEEQLTLDWSTAAGIVSTVLLSWGLRDFLVNRMYDVEAWSTYEETDEKHQRRAKVLAETTDVMRQALKDPDCGRVVVTAHSLGTSVAHDALLSLRRENEVAGGSDPIVGPLPLFKLRHFVTFGSPVDKINYFFESARSRSHRYRRVIETLRGDIGSVPFARNRKPYVHWINYWDEADIISGPLQSPVAVDDLAHRVDNVHVAGRYFPDPGRSHNGYFRDRVVVDGLFQTICRNAWSYDDLPLIERRGYDYDAVRQGPGRGRGHALKLHVPAVLAPWAGMVWAGGHVLGAEGLATGAMWVTLGALGAVVLNGVVNWARGGRNPV